MLEEKKKRINTNQKFITNFRKNYQRFITKYQHLSSVYEKQGIRKFPKIPLLIEVDKFLWWIRDKKAKGNSFLNVPVKSNTEIESNLIPLVNEFSKYTNDYLENEVVPNYLRISNAFSSTESIKSLNNDEILDLLFYINAFDDHARYEKGMERVKERFFEENNEVKVKEMISYLLHGKGNYEERLYNCIYNEKYYLKMFGENCKKELFGLMNNDNVPIMNGGILKSMEWLGYGKL